MTVSVQALGGLKWAKKSFQGFSSSSLPDEGMRHERAPIRSIRCASLFKTIYRSPHRTLLHLKTSAARILCSMKRRLKGKAQGWHQSGVLFLEYCASARQNTDHGKLMIDGEAPSTIVPGG